MRLQGVISVVMSSVPMLQPVLHFLFLAVFGRFVRKYSPRHFRENVKRQQKRHHDEMFVWSEHRGRKTGISQLVKKGQWGFLQGTNSKVTEVLGDLLAVHRRQVIPNLCLVPPASWPNSIATKARAIRCLSQQPNIIQHSSHTD